MQLDVNSLHSLRTKDFRSDQKKAKSGRYPSGIRLYKHSGEVANPCQRLNSKILSRPTGWQTGCQDCTTVYIGETSRLGRKEHSGFTKRHPKNNEERTKLERSSAIAPHVLETEHHVDFNNPEILSKYWANCRDRLSAEQWFISHQPEACSLECKTTHPRWNLI